jgi:hypothetical protein
MTFPPRLRKAFRPRVWWWIAAAIVLHLSAWTAWFAIAARHDVAEVPLAATPAR